MQADALPKLREIPVRGDVLLTLRLEKGWEHPKEFCKLARYSEERLARVEKGGQAIYRKSLMRIARTLETSWQALVDWEAIERLGLSTPHSTQRPKLGNHKILITQADEQAKPSLNIHELVKAFGELAKANGKIVSVAVSDGKLTVGLEITDAAAINFAESYFDAPVEAGKLVSATLLLDYRVMDVVVGGGGFRSKLRDWFDVRRKHLAYFIIYKLGIIKVDASDLPLDTEYYYCRYKKFEHRLNQAVAIGLADKVMCWFERSSPGTLAYIFKPGGFGRMEGDLYNKQPKRRVTWLEVDRPRSSSSQHETK